MRKRYPTITFYYTRWHTLCIFVFTLQKGLNQNLLWSPGYQPTWITHIPWSRRFLPNSLLYTCNISPHSIKDNTFKHNLHDSIHWLPLFQHILKVIDPTLSRGPEVLRLHSVFIWYHSPVCSYLLPSNLQLHMNSSGQDSVIWIYFWIYFCAKSQARILVLCSWSPIIFLGNLSLL